MEKQVIKKVKKSATKANSQVKNTSSKAVKKTASKTVEHPEAKEQKVIKEVEKQQKTASKTVEHPEAKEQKVIKEVEKQQKTASLVEVVKAHREVKYLYPEDVTNTLDRKTWRQKVRNKLHKLEIAYRRIQDQNTEEAKAAKKAFEEFRAQVMKPVAELV